MTEMDAKENALANNRRGSLADAAQGQMTVLLTRQARNQQMALIAEYRRQLAAEEAKIDAKLNDDTYYNSHPDEDWTGLKKRIAENRRSLDEKEAALVDIPRENFADQFGLEDSDIQDENEDFEAEARNLPTRTIRNTSRIADAIRRRLPWSRRIAPEQQREIIELLPPRQANADAELEDDDWDAGNRPVISWWQNMQQARRRGRLYFIKEIGRYLLIPGAVISGVALYRNFDPSVDDELLRIFLALPTDHWFRQRHCNMGSFDQLNTQS